MMILIVKILMLAILLGVIPVYAEISECPPDSSKLQWGMCLRQIQKLHKSEPLGQVKDSLIYEWEFPLTLSVKSDSTPKVYYTTRVGRLIDVLYVIPQSGSDLNKSAADFQTVKSLIDKKYGSGKDIPLMHGPNTNKQEVRKNFRKLKRTPCGGFLAKGILCTYWETKGMTIVHALIKKKNSSYQQFINYKPNSKQTVQKKIDYFFEPLIEFN